MNVPETSIKVNTILKRISDSSENFDTRFFSYFSTIKKAFSLLETGSKMQIKYGYRQSHELAILVVHLSKLPFSQETSFQEFLFETNKSKVGQFIVILPAERITWNENFLIIIQAEIYNETDNYNSIRSLSPKELTVIKI